MSLTKTNKLPELARIALWVGVSASSAVLLLGAKNITHNSKDWKEFAAIGSLGAIIGAHYGITKNRWFNMPMFFINKYFK
tara:strand:+ start:337 stop:576 length:240 start_codon:yes stop_codon:yes gene_type:complete